MKPKGIWQGGKLFNSKKQWIFQWIQIGVLLLLAIAVVALTIVNVMGMRESIHASTERYVEDVARQLALDIETLLLKDSQELELLADSLLRIEHGPNQEELEEFLNRKVEILAFDALLYFCEKGDVHTAGSVALSEEELAEIRRAFQGEGSLFLLDGQKIINAIPLYEEERVVGVLAGLRNKNNMQALIQPKSFMGKGLSCIADSRGQVIISPTDLDPFLQLDSIFFEDGDPETVQDIQQMREDMRNHRDGVVTFSAVNGMELILSYNAMQAFDWVLLTLVPADLIVSEVNVHISRMFRIVVGMILVPFLFFMAFLRTYWNHRRQLERFAFMDPIAGGINHEAFGLRCRELLSAQPKGTYTMVSMQLRNFNLINEAAGSAEGNATLRYIMETLRRHLREDEAACRGEGEHFLLLLRENQPLDVQRRLDEMLTDINSFNQTRDTVYLLTFQQGAYLVEDPDLEIAVIEDRAKVADREHSGGGCVFYDAAFTKRLQREHDLNAMFRGALEQGEFQLYLQPKVGLEENRIAGAEALVRWEHDGEMIYPSDFIPLFERNGNIRALDFYMFRRVCEYLAQRLQENRQVFPISVNLSRQHFRTSNFLSRLDAIAEGYRVPRGLIEFELTESIFFDDQQIKAVKESIREMHRYGFSCSLDDFGSGFSSLGLLKEFDVDAIKLDRRFFLGLSQPKAKDVVACLIALASRLGVSTVAEGIESEEQLAYLRQLGCDMVQGYLFSPPVPAEALEDWMERFMKESEERD